MTEYITKEQAINVVNTAFGHIYDTDSTTVCLIDLQNEIIMTIDEHTEPADVVEVVRCKDCKHSNQYGGGCWHCEKYEGLFSAVNPNDYCSYGWDGDQQ